MDRISEITQALATCMCAQIIEDGSPEPCFCGVIGGEAAIADYAGDCDFKCGMAWVRVQAVYPSVTPGQLNESQQNCGSLLGIDIEMGIMRCVHVGDESGNLPTDAEQLADAQQQNTDAMTMWRAISCCEAVTTKEYILGTYAPMGPLGGYGGGSWTLSVTI